MNIAAKVAIERAEHPDRFCRYPRCLWRTHRNGVRISYCQKHERSAAAEEQSPAVPPSGVPAHVPALAAEPLPFLRRVTCRRAGCDFTTLTPEAGIVPMATQRAHDDAAHPREHHWQTTYATDAERRAWLERQP